jgi:streptomycin 6-kinase
MRFPGRAPLRLAVSAALITTSHNYAIANPEVMVWWNGEGAAPILAHARDAIVMERARSGVSLAERLIKPEAAFVLS